VEFFYFFWHELARITTNQPEMTRLAFELQDVHHKEVAQAFPTILTNSVVLRQFDPPSPRKPSWLRRGKPACAERGWGDLTTAQIPFRLRFGFS
jgi:hypothetical protein